MPLSHAIDQLPNTSNIALKIVDTAVAVSLDGVLVPIQGGVVLPGDSRYEEASCGTLSHYNKEGDPLVTRRYGCMPEHKKLSMKEFLRKEVDYAIACRPDLQLVKVADGARDNWTFLDHELPKGISVLDFCHAAEHLKKAFEIAYGLKETKASIEFAKYRSVLRHDKRGIEKIVMISISVTPVIYGLLFRVTFRMFFPCDAQLGKSQSYCSYAPFSSQ